MAVMSRCSGLVQWPVADQDGEGEVTVNLFFKAYFYGEFPAIAVEWYGDNLMIGYMRN